jgi:hypothetical protein
VREVGILIPLLGKQVVLPAKKDGVDGALLLQPEERIL